MSINVSGLGCAPGNTALDSEYHQEGIVGAAVSVSFALNSRKSRLYLLTSLFVHQWLQQHGIERVSSIASDVEYNLARTVTSYHLCSYDDYR